MTTLIDTHCHLNFYEPEIVEGVIARAKENGVGKFVNIGTSLEDSEVAVSQSSKFENVFATVGLHPNDNPEIAEENVDWEKVETLAKSPKVVAIGECGLDYSRLMSTQDGLQQIEMDRQKKIFIAQVKIANKLDLPLSIHIRDAYEDIVELLKRVPHPVRAVFHCMSGPVDYLNTLLGLESNHELYFSFAGNVTFKNANGIRELVKLVPINKLLVETDCPYLTPEPFRGGKNEPANVRLVAEKLAEVKALSLDEIADKTTQNAVKLFNL